MSQLQMHLTIVVGVSVLFISPMAALRAQDAPADREPGSERLRRIRAQVAEAWGNVRGEPNAPPDGNLPRVIFGNDDRIEPYETTEPDLARLADAACAIVDVSEISQNPDGSYDLATGSFDWDPENGMPLCPSERFYGQRTVGFCSGFLVGPDLVATAGHCVGTSDCGTTAFVFGFRQIDASTGPLTTISADDVYFCTEVVVSVFDWFSAADHAVVRLDRPVVGRAPIPVRRQGHVQPGDPLVVVGHPAVLPTKIAAGAVVKNARQGAVYFEANLDAYGGNSGSMVVNLNDFRVEGILVRGYDDFEVDLVNQCSISHICPDETGCNGYFEDVSKAAAITAYLPPLPEEVPPSLISVSPPKDSIVVGLESVTVVFNEVVTGMQPTSLKVRTLPAAAVTGSGSGPYVFTGFTATAVGLAVVTLSPAGIQDMHGDGYSGDAWRYVIQVPEPPETGAIVPAPGSTIGSLPLIEITFSERVLGVVAEALTVNGSKASSMSGSAAGPYRFAGFTQPGPGAVNVALASSSIHDESDLPFADEQWFYEIPDCNDNGTSDEADLSGGGSIDCNIDGIPDECQPEMLTLTLGAEPQLEVNEIITLGGTPTATGSSPPFTYQWSLPGNTRGRVSSVGANPTYAVRATGTYTIELTVTDSAGCSRSASTTLTVEAVGPAGNPLLGDCGGGCGGAGILTLMLAIGGFVGAMTHRRYLQRRGRRPAK